jgi:hypothetical protein
MYNKAAWRAIGQRQVLRRPVVMQSMPQRRPLDEEFRSRGYIAVPRVVAQDALPRLRDICCAYMRDRAGGEMPSSQFLSIDELAAIPFKPAVTGALRQILGDGYTTYPTFRVNAGLFTNWHLDNNYRPDFSASGTYIHPWESGHAQCILYLQDNDARVGGGLDVLPGSHRIPGMPQSVFFRKLNRVVNFVRQPVSLATKAGDLVVFDIRLLHRGTQAHEPSGGIKLFITWSASRSTEAHAGRFMSYYVERRDHLKRLGERSPQHESILSNYDDLMAVRYPEDYPLAIVQSANAQGIKVASFRSMPRAFESDATSRAAQGI